MKESLFYQKNRTRGMRALLLILIIISNSALGQDWLNIYNESVQNYEDGNLDVALEGATNALNLYEEENGTNDPNYCSILRQVAIINYSLGEIAQSISYQKKEVEILRTLPDLTSETLLGALNNLGIFHQSAGEYIEAEKVYEEIIKLYIDQGISNTESHVARGMLAISQFALEKLDEAGENFESCLEYFSSQDELPPEYLDILLNYGIFLSVRKQFDDSQEVLIEAQDYFKQLEMTDGPEYLLLLANLGKTRDAKGDLEGAVSDLEEALKLSSDLYGESDSETVAIKNDLALIYQKQGNSEKVDALTASVDSNTLDDEAKLDYAISISNQGALQQSEGNLEKARELYLEAIEIFSNQGKETNSYLTTLMNLGYLYQSQGKPNDARQQYETAQSVARESLGETSVQYAETLVSIANLNRMENRIEGTEGLYLQSLRILEANDGTAKETARSREGLALYYLTLQDFDAAQENFLIAMNLYSTNNEQDRLLVTKNNYAILKQAKGEYQEAEMLLREIYEKRSNDAPGSLEEAIAAENLGSLLIEMAKYSEAEEKFSTALSLRESYGKNTPEYANGILNMARLRVREGKYTDAEPLYNQALDIYKSAYGENNINVANLENNMALMYQYMGNLNKAEELLSSSADKVLALLGDAHPGYSTALQNKASLLQQMGRREEALNLLQKALEVDQKVLGESHPNYAFTLHNLASLYLDEQDYSRAEELFLKSVEIEKSVLGEDHPTYASTLNNLGVLFERQGDYEKSEAYFTQALSIKEKVLGKGHPDYAFSQYGLAVLYLKMGKLEESKSLYEESISNYLDQVQNYFPSLSEKEKSDFYAKIQRIIENFKEFAIEYATNNEGSLSSPLIGEIYNVQLSTKALLLNASNKVRNRIAASGDLELRNLFDQWVEIKESLAKYYQYNLAQLQSEQIDIKSLEENANQLEKEISLRSEIFASEFDKQPATWEQVKEKLGDTEAAVEILRVERNTTTDTIMYVALILRKDLQFPKMVILSHGESLETNMYKFYKNAISFKMEDDYTYNAFWSEIDRELPGMDRVYVSADGVFNKVNLNTLYIPESGDFILNKYEIVLLSNTKELLEEKSLSGNKTATLLGYAEYQSGIVQDPQPHGVFQALGAGGWLKSGIPMLEGTKKEVVNIAEQLDANGWQYSSLETTNATEGALKKIDNQGLIHIATHGFFLEDLKIDESGDGFGSHVKNYEMNPLFRSGLLLAGSGETIFGESNQTDGEDGILTAYEVMNLSLENTDLVVLSACETGLGEIKNGEGVYGLQRALIVAGAKGIIMSLWKVNDETTQMLMTLFYENWLSGMSKLEAFKKAQITLKEEYSDPYYWGAFVMIGR